MSYRGKDAAWLIAERITEYHQEKKQQEYLRHQQYIQHKKHMRCLRKSVCMLTMAASVMMALCGTIVTLELQVKEREARLASLRVEISDLKKENQEAEKRLSQEADYQWVREEAVKMGMSRATADRVIYYSVEDSDYMEQHSNIPTG